MSVCSDPASILWIAEKEFNQLVADRCAFRTKIGHQLAFQAARLVHIGATCAFQASLKRLVHAGDDLCPDCRKQQSVRLVQEYGCPVRRCAWLVTLRF